MSIGRQRFRRMGPISLAIVIFALPSGALAAYRFGQLQPTPPAHSGTPLNYLLGLAFAVGVVLPACFGAVCLLLAHPIRTVYIALSIGLVCEAIATLFGGIPVQYLDIPGAPMIAAVWISAICLYFAVPKSWQPRTHTCPKCEYNLEGMPADATQCPECGTDIAPHIT